MKKAGNKWIIGVLAACGILLVSGCKEKGSVTPSVEASGSVTESTAESTSESTAESTGETGQTKESASSPAQDETLTQEELTALEAYLNSSGQIQCLTSYYESPEEVSANAMFYSYFSQSHQLIPEELELLGWEETFDVARYTTQELDEALMKHFGITLSQLKNQPEMDYLEQYDAYYINVSDTNISMITCKSGVRKADQTIVLTYATWEEDGDWEVTLRPAGDGYQFISNVNLTIGRNRDFLLQTKDRWDQLKSREDESFIYYFDGETKELVCAMDKPGDGRMVRELYFLDGGCILIRIPEDTWSSPKDAYSEELGMSIGRTLSYYDSTGKEILAKFETAGK